MKKKAETKSTNSIKRVLITGSSGMIGTRLFEKLLAGGYKIMGFDRRLNKYIPELNSRTIIGDLLDRADVNNIAVNFDIIIHLAANPGVVSSVLEPRLAVENTVSTYNILDFARKNKVKRFIFSSSREVYGNRIKIVAKEDVVNIKLCESPYAASKISDEALIYSFSKCYGLDYIVCRFSNVYGMYDESARFISRVIKEMRGNKIVEIYGKDKVLDFTYIDDCIDGILKCIKNFSKVKNNVFNIASGRGEKLIDVAKILRRELDSDSKIKIGDNRPGEVVKFVADITKAKKMINYRPEYSTEQGIKLAISWYSESGEPKRKINGKK